MPAVGRPWPSDDNDDDDEDDDDDDNQGQTSPPKNQEIINFQTNVSLDA